MNRHKIPCLALAGLLLCASAADAEIYTVPLLISSVASGGPQGVVRILNGADGSGTVTVHAIDDDGVRHGPATFTLNASAAVEFTAGDLAAGNAAKGLSGGIGRRSGDARLEIDTDLDIVPLAFVRAPDGALSAMHDTVRAASATGPGQYRYEVPAFNPASDAVQASRLRLINPGDAAAAVTVAGRDDSGAAATGGDVRLTLPAGGARTLTALQLEVGDAGLEGRLGAGTGRWRLTVAADAPLEVVNVVAAPAGYWSNLSTTAASGLVPTDLGAMNERFAGRAVVYRSGSSRVTLNASQGERFSETAESDGVTTTYTGRYGYEAVGPDAGRLTLTYDNGAVCRLNMYFDLRMAGWFASHCTGGGYPADGYRLGGSWSVGDPGGGGSSYGAGDTVATLPAGSWTPDIISGGGFSLSGGEVTIRLGNGGYIEEGGYRYTCQSAGGCEVVNRQVRSGTIAQTAAGTPPGTRPPPADTSPSFADGSGPGDQSYTAGAAIAPLTLPAASGGDGTLTYTLTPTVPGLSFDAATRRLTGTPSAAGAHDMAYTATDADGDTATLRFGIAVRAAGGGPAGFDLDADNGRAEGVAWAGGRVHVVDRGADKAFAYGAGGQREAASDFDLDADNGSPTGIAWSGSSFHVVDGADDKVYAYGADGRREAASDFDLHGDNGRAEGVVHAGGRLYVVDRGADRVFAYGAGGQREAAAEFDLHGDNGSPSGIAWSDGRFYVADATDDKVYAYTAGGERDAASDFDLDGDNGNPAGIAWAGGAFLVADATDDKVYAYADAPGPGGGGEASYGTGDTVATLPTGFWTPDVTSGGSFGATGGDVTVRLDNGGYIEEGGHRYTCQSAGGCEIVNRRVESGTIAQTAAGAPPGTSPPPADTSPSFAAGSGPGDQSYTVGTAIDALTLPAASGGDGTLTYSLSPAVPGLSFDPATRRLTGTPSAAGDYAMTYTATDGDGDTATLGFNIAVEQADGDGATASFDLEDGSVPGAITYANGTFYVGDEFHKKLFAYRSSGQRDAAADIDLHGDNGFPVGIAYAKNRIYVLDHDDAKVYAYRLTGRRDTASEFDLARDNRNPYSIAYANDRFYVTDYRDGRVYVYDATGQRHASLEFGLDEGGSRGIVYANGRFYVVDNADEKVYVYNSSGQRDAASDFDLDDGHHHPGEIAYANGRFHVIDLYKVYSYSRPVEPGTQPAFASGGGPDSLSYTAGTEVVPLKLPTASGGDGTLVYSLSPAIRGMVFNTVTRQLTGAPAAAGAYAMTYTAMDADGDTDSLAFIITVAASGTLSDIPSRMIAAEGATVDLRSTVGLYFGFARPACEWTQIGGPAAALQKVGSEKARITVPTVASNGGTLSFRADCTSRGSSLSDIVKVNVVKKKTERTLSALVDFLDVPAADRPLTRRNMADILTDGPDSLERFLEASSRGLLDIQFDLLDWVTVDRTRSAYPLGGEAPGIWVIEDVVDKLSLVTDLGAYDKVFPAIFPLEQGYPGCAAFQEPLTWITPNGTFRLGAAWLSGYDMSCVIKGRHAHEYGHTFGFAHSLAITCHTEYGVPGSTIDPLDENDSCYTANECANEDCTILRRGPSGVVVNWDPDMLGGDGSQYYEDHFPMHYQAVWQARAGWLAEAQVVVADRTRQEWITSLETLTPTPKAIKIPLGNDHNGDVQSYWLETRLRYPHFRGYNNDIGEVCAAHVRLEANTVLGTSERNGTYRFSPHPDRDAADFSVAQWHKPFLDPHRGIAVEIQDCIEDDDEVAVNVLVSRTRLEVDPPVVALLDRGTATVSLRNEESGPVNVGSVSIGGRDPTSFSITSDTCSGASLASGDTCTVEVRGLTGGTVALLRIPNDDDLIPQAAVTLMRR